MAQKGRNVPAQSHAEYLKAQARQSALLSLDPAIMRAWAHVWAVPLIATTDADLLASMHAAIMRDDAMPAASRIASARMLAGQGDAVAQAMLAELERIA